MAADLRPASDEELALAEEAGHARENAYVPYSGFRVGAAVRMRDGSIVHGCNVENAAYSVTNCAERTALFRLIAEGRAVSDITGIAVSVDGAEGSPCGACRQVMVELAPNVPITFRTGGEWRTTTVIDLLPGAFLPEALDA